LSIEELILRANLDYENFIIEEIHIKAYSVCKICRRSFKL